MLERCTAGWLKPENRSLVPFNGFECAPEPNLETKKKDVPLTVFAGIWTAFKGVIGHQVKVDPRSSQRLWLSDEAAERCR
ncbi:hypothetical protein I6F38_26915 [Bradyrhizobium sp. BRP56]|nr:hypothetical protein [Bradyrhizobium sp. BRP56]